MQVFPIIELLGINLADNWRQANPVSLATAFQELTVSDFGSFEGKESRLKMFSNLRECKKVVLEFTIANNSANH